MIDVLSEKTRISEMAIRGLLSCRTIVTMSVDAIISAVITEREALISNKNTKITKRSEMLDEIPFEVPNGWKWVALGDLCILLSRGKSPTYSEEMKYPVFAQKCNQPHYLALEKALFLDESTLGKWPLYFRLRDTDIVINSTGTGTVGRVGYYTTETLDPKYEFMVPDSHVTVVRVGKNIVSKYIYYALRTTTIQQIMEKTYRGSTNQKEFYVDSVYSIPVPLPPFEEQQKIVEVLDQAFEQLNIIDNLQQQYNFNKDILKRKLIDAGIQGKLTEQLAEDGNATDLFELIQKERHKLIREGRSKSQKTKPLHNDYPFIIPSNWKWVKIGDIEEINLGFTYRPEYVDEGVYFLSAKDITNGRICFENAKKVSYETYKNAAYGSKPHKGDILFCRVGTIGKPQVIYDNVDFCIFVSLGFLRDHLSILVPEYIAFWMNSKLFSRQVDIQVKGALQKNLNTGWLKEFLIPLPPIPEQRRIVERIQELLSLIEL